MVITWRRIPVAEVDSPVPVPEDASETLMNLPMAMESALRATSQHTSNSPLRPESGLRASPRQSPPSTVSSRTPLFSPGSTLGPDDLVGTGRWIRPSPDVRAGAEHGPAADATMRGEPPGQDGDAGADAGTASRGEVNEVAPTHDIPVPQVERSASTNAAAAAAAAAIATENILSLATTTLPPLSRTRGAPSAVALNATAQSSLFATVGAAGPAEESQEEQRAPAMSAAEARNPMDRSGTLARMSPRPTPRPFSAEGNPSVYDQLEQLCQAAVPSRPASPNTSRRPSAASSSLSSSAQATPRNRHRFTVRPPPENSENTAPAPDVSGGDHHNRTPASGRGPRRPPLRQQPLQQQSSNTNSAPAPTFAASCGHGPRNETFTVVATPVQQQLHDLHSALHDALQRTEQLRSQLTLEGTGTASAGPSAEDGDNSFIANGETACDRLAVTLRAVSNIVENAAFAADVERNRNEQRVHVNDENVMPQGQDRGTNVASGSPTCGAQQPGRASRDAHAMASPTTDGSAIIAPFSPCLAT